MLNIVLTGTATDELGQPVVRADLEAACKQAGFTVRKEFPKGTPYTLVASRLDTVKAKKALAVGVMPWSYKDLLATLKQMGAELKKTGAAPDPWVDAKPKMQAPTYSTDDTVGYGGDL